MKNKINDFANRLKLKYSALSSEKRLKVIFIISFIFIAFLFYFTYPSKKNHNKIKDNTTKVVMKDEEFAKEKWLGSAEKQIIELRREVQELRQELSRLKGNSVDISNSEDLLNKQSNVSREIKKKDTLLDRINEVVSKAPVKQAKVEDITPPAPNYKEPQPKQNSRVQNQKVNTTPRPTPPAKKNEQKAAQQGVKNNNSMTVIEIADNTDNQNSGQNATKKTFYIPATTFVRGMLLTGLDAPTGVKSTKTPHPVLIRLQDLSFLPNEFRQDILGCRLLGEGYGELSSERAYIRLVSLSCIDNNSKEVISTGVKGYIADSDGKIGLRGEVVSKQGMFLARSLVSAFIQGVAEGFKTSQQTIVTTSEGTVASNDIKNFADGFKSGFSSGAAEAAEKLSEFYMKLAEEMFPVIEIGALRNITIVFSADVNAEFNKKFN